MKAPKPFVLDLGARQVKVELGELHDKLGYAMLKERRIILDPAQGGQEITASLWHEVMHHLDDVYMDNWLGGDHDEDAKHGRLDVLANLIDMVLSKNWKIFNELYKAR